MPTVINPAYDFHVPPVLDDKIELQLAGSITCVET